jgi:hypothetical protein
MIILIDLSRTKKFLHFADYMAASSKFSDYLPLIQEMINSFEVTNQKYDEQVPNIFTNIESSGYKSC